MKIGMMFSLKKKFNIIFNNFLNTFLRIFCSSFPVKKSHYSYNKKPWLTRDIRISLANKRKLYPTYRNSKDSYFKEYYKKYCQTLSVVIMFAKNFFITDFNRILTTGLKLPGTTLKLLLIIEVLTIIYQQ